MKKIRYTNHKITAALLVAVMMLSVIFTAVFSGGVKAKADTGTSHSQSFKDFSKSGYDNNGFFKFASTTDSKLGSKTLKGGMIYNGESYSVGLKLNNAGKISFTSENETGVVTVVAASATSIKIDNKEYALNTKGGIVSVVVSGTSHSIEKSSSEAVVFEVTYTPGQTEPTNSYNITVSDNGKSTTGIYTEGATLKLSATGDNLLYWKNSNNVIVATEDKEIPVYYSDTYTAVYAKTSAKVEYLTPYGGVLETYYADDEITEPNGPTRYGYTFAGWDTDVETVKTSLADGKDVTVSPKYKDNADLKFTITVDTTELDGLQSTDSYTVNTEVKASTTSDDFAYWADGDGKPLSYNSTYYFLANRDITVKAVKKSDSDNNATEKPIITKVKYDTATKTIIFEYTVPEEYTINFAGVLASTNETNLNNATVDAYEKGVYKLGTSEGAGYKTVRYTLKNAGIDTWYVKPILTYKSATGTDTIYGDVVIMN